jgi:hypothetical protein
LTQVDMDAVVRREAELVHLHADWLEHRQRRNQISLATSFGHRLRRHTFDPCASEATAFALLATRPGSSTLHAKRMR